MSRPAVNPEDFTDHMPKVVDVIASDGAKISLPEWFVANHGRAPHRSWEMAWAVAAVSCATLWAGIYVRRVQAST